MSSLISDLLRTASLIHQGTTPGSLVKRAKFCLRGLMFARETQEWFEFLQRPEMAFIVERNPCLYHKLQRPYLNKMLDTGGRLDALKQHYQFLLAHLPAPMMKEMHGFPGSLLAEISAEDTGPLELRVASSTMEKEGELMIFLRNPELKKRLATLTFSVWKYGTDGQEIFIGGLQGSKWTSEDTIVAVTRALYGLRPKALVVFALQQLAASWDITHLRAVSDNIHIYRHFQKRQKVAASYDSFWKECGGILNPDKTFDLPAAFVPRDISTIRVNKRQMYRRRYVMLEDIARQIRISLNGKEAIARAA